MIISLRGASGAGKSHLVRMVALRYWLHRNVFEEGRRKPLYTIHGRNARGRTLVTPGHYEIANGGIDTLPDLDSAYRIARWADGNNHDVLMEGKNMSDGLRHVNELRAAKFDVRLVAIIQPVEASVNAVRERGHRIAEKSIRLVHEKVLRDYQAFEGEKFGGSREACLTKIEEWLGPFEERGE